MPLLQANDIIINYSLQGPSNGETIVLINGLADDLATWSAQLPPLLAAGHRVLTFDNRGIGKTSKPIARYSASLLVADTKALVTALGISKFNLMGVSMGGMIAQEYALTYPSDLISLTLACTYAAPGPFCSKMFTMWKNMALSSDNGMALVTTDTLLWCFTPEFFTKRGEEVREIEKAYEEGGMSADVYLSQLAAVREFDTRDKLFRLGDGDGPKGMKEEFKVLVLAGEQDILIPTSLSRELWEMIPGAEWRTVKGGHGCMWEFPESFNEAFLEFLQRSKR
ncbi:hypothetical protein MMC30_002277 [Trapelia coarctata]|nr:hypothetical protein [Trapelia coarctata]